MLNEFDFKFHGVSVALKCDNPGFLEPIARIFNRYKVDDSPKSDFQVNIVKDDAFWGGTGSPENPDALVDGMEKIGRRVFVRGGDVFIYAFVNYPGLMAWLQDSADQTVLNLIYSDVFIDLDVDRYQSLHQIFGIFPVATFFAKKKNRFFLHGGAVRFNGACVAFCGLQGVGKSTLLLRMLRRENAKFLSDNIYFHDENNIYACPETIRIDDASLRFIDPPSDLLVDIGENSDLGRKMYLVNTDYVMDEMSPDIFVVPRFHPEKSGIAPVAEDPVNLFMGFNELAMELSNFNQWSAPFLLLDGCFSSKRIDALSKILRGKKIYHLNIKKGDPPDSIVKLIEDVL